MVYKNLGGIAPVVLFTHKTEPKRNKTKCSKAKQNEIKDCILAPKFLREVLSGLSEYTSMCLFSTYDTLYSESFKFTCIGNYLHFQNEGTEEEREREVRGWMGISQ